MRILSPPQRDRDFKEWADSRSQIADSRDESASKAMGLFQLGKSLIQFFFARCAGDVVSDDAAKGVGFHWGHFMVDFLNDDPANGGKGVAIVKTER